MPLPRFELEPAESINRKEIKKKIYHCIKNTIILQKKTTDGGDMLTGGQVS